MAKSEPSAFWCRLVDALTDINWPTTQNGLATKLDMSQGSVLHCQFFTEHHCQIRAVEYLSVVNATGAILCAPNPTKRKNR